MQLITVTDLQTQKPVTVIVENICSIQESVDTAGTAISLVNGDTVIAQEAMIDIVTELQLLKMNS